MKKSCIFLLLSFLTVMDVFSQNFSITGTVKDQMTQEAVELATIQLLKSDSTFITGANTTANGSFNIHPKSAGKYIIKISFVGYNSRFFPIQLTDKAPSHTLGTILLEMNAISLKAAEVTAKAAQVEMKNDTTMYNAAAFRVPEGSTLEALIEKLPGVEVADDGTVKVNGKTVKEFLINGKDFFKGDTKIAMKNLPSSMVQKVKSYDKKSDYSEQTGIDDGEEQAVLDINLKRELNQSWVSNIDLSYGNKDRYSEKFFVNRFTNTSRITMFGSLNNINDAGFRGGGFRGGNSGLVASKTAGIDANWNNGKKKRTNGYFEINGSANYAHTGSDNNTTTNSETFLTSNSKSSFGNSQSFSNNSSTNFNSRIRLEWNPDSLTTILFNPSFSHSDSNGRSKSRSATFNANPYLIPNVTDPLYSIFEEDNDSLKSIAVNRNLRESLSHSNSNSANAWFMAIRRLNNKGRSLSLNGSAGYTNSSNVSFSNSEIKYFQSLTPDQKTYQYNLNPSKSWNYNARLSYSEPLFKNAFLQASYQFSYKYSDSDRSLYNLEELQEWKNGEIPPIGTLPSSADSLAKVINLRNSQYATYKDYNHNASIGLRYNTDNIRMYASVDFQPQTTKMNYAKDKIDTLITRNIFKVSPNVRFRYNFSKTERIDIRYRGSSGEPSMTNLLDVTDDSDPLNITKGNPGLKPSWTNSLNLWYNNYIAEQQRGFMVNASFSQTSNSISNSILYDETTGKRTITPENINGNWNARGDFMFNTALGTEKAFNISTFTNLNYDNSVGYVSTSSSTGSQKNTTKTFNIGETLRGNYRNDWFEVGLNGRINYQHSRNELQSNANMDTYLFNYGTNFNISLPWSMSVSTDIGVSSRRGYTDDAMNTNEIIWNAQVAQSFFKNKAATLSIQFYDILHQQSNVSRIINAQMRSDSWNNAINSYFMVHFIYRLNIFGGKTASNDGNNERGRERGPAMHRMGTPMMGPGRMH